MEPPLDTRLPLFSVHNSRTKTCIRVILLLPFPRSHNFTLWLHHIISICISIRVLICYVYVFYVYLSHSIDKRVWCGLWGNKRWPDQSVLWWTLNLPKLLLWFVVIWFILLKHIRAGTITLERNTLSQIRHRLTKVPQGCHVCLRATRSARTSCR